MLTEEEITLIRETAVLLSEDEVPVTNTFYTNLFKAAPEVRSLFPDEMFEQSQKLWDSVVMVVESIEDLDAIAPALALLGKRHVGYGASPELYDAVAAILVQTLAQHSGATWTPAHGAAWSKALDAVVGMMLSGANDQAA